MFDVGFGDAFLLTFPAEDRPRKVFIDCGYHAAGPPRERKFSGMVDRILADLKEGDAPRADVVIATHRHRDHVYGFENEKWHGVQVSEVWMPWTEHPTDPEARKIRRSQARKAAAVARSLALGGARDDNARRARLLLENNLKNAEAMAMLKSGLGGTPPARFLPEPAAEGQPLLPQPFETPLRPGVKVHVLGPSRDRDTIRDMDPPVQESFLRAARDAEGGGGAVPLDDRWAISARGRGFAAWFRKTERAARRFRRNPATSLSGSDPDFVTKWVASLGFGSRDVAKVDRFAAENPLAAAVAIEEAVNGTSLMLVFEIGRAVLLFPGDAQWGTWKNAMQTARPLLERVNFLKVGHHGSHNATPQTFVKQILGTDFKAMVSTRTTKLYKEIPRIPLLDALRAQQESPGVARSD